MHFLTKFSNFSSVKQTLTTYYLEMYMKITGNS